MSVLRSSSRIDWRDGSNPVTLSPLVVVDSIEYLCFFALTNFKSRRWNYAVLYMLFTPSSLPLIEKGDKEEASGLSSYWQCHGPIDKTIKRSFLSFSRFMYDERNIKNDNSFVADLKEYVFHWYKYMLHDTILGRKKHVSCRQLVQPYQKPPLPLLSHYSRRVSSRKKRWSQTQELLHNSGRRHRYLWLSSCSAFSLQFAS